MKINILKYELNTFLILLRTVNIADMTVLITVTIRSSFSLFYTEHNNVIVSTTAFHSIGTPIESWLLPNIIIGGFHCFQK
jgi:hypothetical protein